MAKPCTPQPIAQRVQLFEPKARNASLSLGVQKGVFSFAKENTPFEGQQRNALRSLPLKGEIKGKLSSEREYPLCLAVALSAALSMQRNALRSLPFLGAQKKSRPMDGSHFCSISQCG